MQKWMKWSASSTSASGATQPSWNGGSSGEISHSRGRAERRRRRRSSSRSRDDARTSIRVLCRVVLFCVATDRTPTGPLGTWRSRSTCMLARVGQMCEHRFRCRAIACVTPPPFVCALHASRRGRPGQAPCSVLRSARTCPPGSLARRCRCGGCNEGQ